MSVKQNIVVGIIFAVLIVSVAFFLRLPDNIELKPQPAGVDMSNDVVNPNDIPAPKWTTVDIRVLNLDTVAHKVAFEMSYQPVTIAYNETCYLEPSTYKTYHNVSVRDDIYAFRVVKDRTIARTNYVSFAGVKVFEIQLTPETIDFCYIKNESISLERIGPNT